MEKEKDTVVNENQEETVLDENEEIVTLTYDDGEQEDFYTLAELDYKGKWYIFMEPVEPSEDFAEDEVIIYEIASDEQGDEVFIPVEDDALMDELIAMFNAELEQE